MGMAYCLPTVHVALHLGVVWSGRHRGIATSLLPCLDVVWMTLQLDVVVREMQSSRCHHDSTGQPRFYQSCNVTAYGQGFPMASPKLPRSALVVGRGREGNVLKIHKKALVNEVK